MTCWVYVLYSLSKKTLYIGSSDEPDLRLHTHNLGKVCSTKSGIPWVRVWLEETENRTLALKRERYLKSGWGRRWLAGKIDLGRWQSG